MIPGVSILKTESVRNSSKPITTERSKVTTSGKAKTFTHQGSKSNRSKTSHSQPKASSKRAVVEPEPIDVVEDIERFEITNEKYDATKRAMRSFVQNFSIIDMVFNKVDAFKVAVSDLHRNQSVLEAPQKPDEEAREENNKPHLSFAQRTKTMVASNWQSRSNTQKDLLAPGDNGSKRKTLEDAQRKTSFSFSAATV